MTRTRSPGRAPHDARNRRQRELIDRRMDELRIDTIMELEDKAGVKRDKVRHFLKGYTKNLSSEVTQAVCGALGVSVFEFTGSAATLSGGSAEQFIYLAEDVTSAPPSAKSVGHIGFVAPAKYGMPGNGNMGGWVIVGDGSMSPLLSKGDFVWVDWVSAFSGVGIYLLRGTDKNAPTMLRRVEPHGITGKLDVSAENARYGTQNNISPNSLRFLGRATHLIKKI